MKRALILGGAPKSGNIGDHICQSLERSERWRAIQDECLAADFGRVRGQGASSDALREYGYKGGEGSDRHRSYAVPDESLFKGGHFDALVVTLGRTYKDPFTSVSQHVLEGVLRANLLMPLESARRYVRGAEEAYERLVADWNDVPRLRREDERPPSRSERHIVFIGSYAHSHPFTNGTLYCAAKAGLDMAARTLGWELTDHGYSVHIIHPYHVNGTPMWAQVERDVMKSKGMTYEEADAYNRKDLRMPDLLRPEEVAEIVATILNVPAMRWLSGTRIELNGGSR